MLYEVITSSTGKYGRNTAIWGWGASMMQNPIYAYVYGALILIAAFAPIIFLIIDKTGS